MTNLTPVSSFDNVRQIEIYEDRRRLYKDMVGKQNSVFGDKT